MHYGAQMQVRLILMGVLLAQLGDAATFTVGVALHGIRLESNGVAVAIYDAAGLQGLLLAKGAAILVTLALLTTTAGRFPRLLVWGSAAATSLGLLGVVANWWSLLLLA